MRGSEQMDDELRVILASASPRRRFLLERAGLTVDVRPADVDETPEPGEAPRALVARLARAKAAAIGGAAASDAAPIVAADTTVVLDETVLNKPLDDDDARRMLERLAGRGHDVLTGFCVRRGPREHVEVVRTEVTFRPLTPRDIDRYLALDDHRDKAGAYGIQSAGGVLVDAVVGSYSNVIGLPLREVLDAIAIVLEGSGP